MGKVIKMKVKSINKWRPNIPQEGFNLNTEPKEINLKNKVDKKLIDTIRSLSKD